MMLVYRQKTCSLDKAFRDDMAQLLEREFYLIFLLETIQLVI